MSQPTRKPTAVETRPNTVGLKQDALTLLLDQVDQGNGKGTNASREFVRWGFRREAILVTLHQPGGGNPTPLKMACRNLSCGGMSVLHSAYTHIGTRAVVQLTHPCKEPLNVEGAVVRCTHLKGVVHEIGIKFAQKVQARDYVSVDPFAGNFSIERVDPEQLKGTGVYVDESASERKLVTHYLRGSSLRLRTAESAAEGIKMIEEGCDLVIADFGIPGTKGGGFIGTLRESGIETPIIAVTADTKSVKRMNLSDWRIGAFLAKPFRQDILLRAVAEFISADSGTRQSGSSLPSDHPNRGLVEGYVEQLRECAAKLGKCAEGADAEATRAVVLQVLGSAGNYGYEAIGKLAQAASTQLSTSKSMTDSLPVVRALQAACEKARA